MYVATDKNNCLSVSVMSFITEIHKSPLMHVQCMPNFSKSEIWVEFDNGSGQKVRNVP